MVLLPPASHTHRPASLPCQSAKQLGQVQTSPVSRHQAPSPHLHPGPWVLPVPHVASDCSPALGSPGPSLPPEVGKCPFPRLYPKSECIGSCWAVKEGTRDPRIHCLSQVLHMGTLIPLQNKSDTCRSCQGLRKVFNSSPHNLGGSP